MREKDGNRDQCKPSRQGSRVASHRLDKARYPSSNENSTPGLHLVSSDKVLR